MLDIAMATSSHDIMCGSVCGLEGVEQVKRLFNRTRIKKRAICCAICVKICVEKIARRQDVLPCRVL